jgi:hypothetical protein
MKNETCLPQTLTRRDFLKTSTVAASAAAVGTLDLSRSAHAAGSDIIKVGMIGCGGRNAGAGAQALAADPGVRATLGGRASREDMLAVRGFEDRIPCLRLSAAPEQHR